jgi:hypothetical protein
LETINLITLAAAFCLEMWLAVLLVRRRVHERFPLFVSYISISAVSSLARLVVIPFLYVRFFVYWSSELLLIMLSLAALNQVFWWTYDDMREFRWFRLLYYGAILVSLGLTIRMAIVSPTVQEHPIISFILDAEIAVNMVRAGIVALFEAMVNPMAVRFQRYPFGIILGFGASSLGPVLAFFAIYVSGTKYEHPAKAFAALSYIIALVIWLRIFSLPDTEPKQMKPPIPPEEMQSTLDGYLEAMGFSRKRKR